MLRFNSMSVAFFFNNCLSLELHTGNNFYLKSAPAVSNKPLTSGIVNKCSLLFLAAVQLTCPFGLKLIIFLSHSTRKEAIHMQISKLLIHFFLTVGGELNASVYSMRKANL